MITTVFPRYVRKNGRDHRAGLGPSTATGQPQPEGMPAATAGLPVRAAGKGVRGAYPPVWGSGGYPRETQSPGKLSPRGYSVRHPVDVVDAVDGADRAQDVAQVLRVAHLKGELA